MSLHRERNTSTGSIGVECPGIVDIIIIASIELSLHALYNYYNINFRSQ